MRAEISCARVLAAGAALASLLGMPAPALSGTVLVPALGGSAQTAAAQASPGDTLLLGPGIHAGPLLLARRVVLRGAPGAILDGGGRGRILEIVASGTIVENLEIRRSGRGLLTADGAVFVRGASGVTLRRLRIREALYGIYAERSGNLAIESCALTGVNSPGAETGDGNGIHFWYCESPRVRDCSVERFADAVYLSFTNGALIERSRFERNARYGFHTMYCQDNHLIANTFARNLAGCAIMFSNHLLVERNDFVHNRGPRTYGLLLRDCSDGSFRENRLVDNTIAVFMDGSNRNAFADNLVADNGWGILLFSSSDGNEFAGNAFLNNDYPVALDMKYTRNRFDDGKSGNFWSENAAYDLDGDLRSDVPYSPVGAFAFVSKQYPDLSVLAHSPAVAALSVAERVIPALRPSEAVDRHPLVSPARFPASRAALGRDGRRPSPSAAAGFLALAVLGGAGLHAGRRAR